jgi:phosphopantetheinyl transferase (holo-ACP synthase)
MGSSRIKVPHYDAPTLDGNPASHCSVSLRSDNSKNAELWLATPAAAERFSVQALSESEAQRYARLRNAAKRQDFAVSRSLRSFLQVRDVPLGTLSHSRGHAALLRISDMQGWGVDLEVHAPKRLASLARFAYSAPEANAVESAPEDQRSRLFYSLWTLKEAFAKALRMPLLEATRACTFEPVDDALRATVPTRQTWSARLFEPRANVSLAVVVLESAAPIALRTCEWPPATEQQWPEPLAIYPR